MLVAELRQWDKEVVGTSDLHSNDNYKGRILHAHTIVDASDNYKGMMLHVHTIIDASDYKSMMLNAHTNFFML